jgi:hypothetical protein
MSEYGKVTPEIRSRLAEIVGEKNVSDTKEDLEKHGIDESLEPPYPPEIVVYASSTEDVSEVMKVAYEARIPVTPRGRGRDSAEDPFLYAGASHSALSGWLRYLR